MAKAKFILEAAMIIGFMLILTGTMLLLMGSFKNNNTVLLIAFIPLGLGILDYIVMIVFILVKLKKKNR